MKHLTKTFFIMIFVFLLSVPLFACSSAEGDPSENPLSYVGVQVRTKTDKPGIRSLYTVDLDAVKALEANGYSVEYGAVIAYVYADQEKDHVSSSRDVTVTYKGANGYAPDCRTAGAVCVYSTDGAPYASNSFVSVEEKTASFAFTVVFSPEMQTKENYNENFVVLGFCHIMQNGETVAMHYSYGEGEYFGTEDSVYGKTISLYNLTLHWIDKNNPDSTDEIRNNANVLSVMAAQRDKEASVTMTTPIALASGASTKTYTLSNMREGIYKVTVGYTASAKYYHKLTYNDRAVVQYINAGTDAKSEIFYVHLKEGDNTVSFTAQTGAITLNSLTFTLVQELSTDVTALSMSLENDRNAITLTEKQEGADSGAILYNDHRFYRLRTGSAAAIRYTNMKAGYYNVYAIGSVSGTTKVTLRSVVGTAADGGETLTTLNATFATMGNGSNGSGGGMLSLGTVQMYEGGNTLHLAMNSGTQLLFNEIVLVPATHTVTYLDTEGNAVSVQRVPHGETPVRPGIKVPEGYALSEYFFDDVPVKEDTVYKAPVYRTAPLTATAGNGITAPSGVSVDSDGYIPLSSGQVATVTLWGATAGYYDLYLDFTATSQVKYLRIENSAISAASQPRFRTRLETSEIGTEAYACSVWLENGTNTLKISPEGNYGFKIRGVKLVNVADGSTAETHIVANTYNTSASVINNTIDGTLNNHNLTIRTGDIIVFPTVNISEDGAYRLYAVGNISNNVKLTLSTIAEGKNASERVSVKTLTASADSSHGTSTSTVLMAINGEDDTFNLSAGTTALALETSGYVHISTFFLVRVGDKKAEPLPEEPEYVLPENPIDIYKDYMPDTIAPTKINEVISSAYMAGESGEEDVYVHKVLVGVDELGLGIYTIVAHPAAEGEYPGVMFIHGGSGQGNDFYEGVIDAAKKGYIAVAYDQPGIAAADCPSTGYNGPNYKFDFTGNPYTATMYKSVVGGLTVFNLLYSNGVIMDDNGDSLSGVSVMKDKIAINGISWGGNMTTMLTGLLGDYVAVAVAKYCTGNYLLSEYWYGRILGQVGSEEMLREYCKYFDPSSFADGITAKFYIIATTMDTYGSLPAVISTYEKAVNAECRDFVTVPNQNHGTTNLTNGANRKGMCTLLEWNYLHYALTGEGTAPVRVTVTDTATDESTTDVTFTVSGEVTEMSLWYSDSTAKWTSSTWTEVTDVVDNGDGTYTVTAPITTGTYYVMVELANGDQYSSVPDILKDEIKDRDYSMNDLRTEGLIKVNGRTGADGDGIICDNALAGFEANIRFKGALQLTVTAKRPTGSTSEDPADVYFTVYVDGVRSETRFCFPEGETTTLTIATSDGMKAHHIRVVKQTEAQFALATLETLSFTGYIDGTPKNNDLYIEVIGDSITTGYGNIWALGDGNAEQSLYQDATQAYPFLIAETLSADISLSGCSGVGAVRGWRTFTASEFYTKNSYYRDTTVAYSSERAPDLVIISLGTNDKYAPSQNGGAVSDEEFKAGVLALIELLRAENKDLPIVLVYGQMTSRLDTVMPEIEAATEGVYVYDLTAVGSGGGGHPSAKEHAYSMNELLTAMRADGLVD